MLTELKPIFSEYIPDHIEEGYIHITEEFECSVHLCPCGCKTKIVLPMGDHTLPDRHEWTYVRNGDFVTFIPSVGNWQIPCKSHYFIQNNKIVQA